MTGLTRATALRRAGRFVALALVFLMGTGAGNTWAAESALLHKPAPQFVRRDFGGKTISLRSYRGRVVLLNFWATWCAPCLQELPRFAAWQREYGEDGLQVIAVSMDDDEAAARALARKMGLDFVVMMGDAGLGKRYGGVLGLPVTFLIDRDGTVAERFESGGHLAQMEEQIKELLAAR